MKRRTFAPLRFALAVALVVPALSIVTSSPARAVPYGTDYPLLNCSAGVPNTPPGTWHQRTCTIGGEILAYYRIMLRRDPDPSGFSHFMGQWTSDEWRRMRDAGYAIVASTEAWNAHGGNYGTMIDDMYQALLSRWPEAGARDGWLGWLSRGYSWGWVVSQVTGSVEYSNRLWANMNNSYPAPGWIETYHEADYYVGGDRPGRLEMHYLNFLSWKNFRKTADWIDPTDWTDDGCSTPFDYQLQLVDQRTCQRHDYGYRNFGHGLMLERTENRRHEIDLQLQSDMYWSCTNHTPSLPSTDLSFCLDTADYEVIRKVR